jgi:hypothetical protein
MHLYQHKEGINVYPVDKPSEIIEISRQNCSSVGLNVWKHLGALFSIFRDYGHTNYWSQFRQKPGPHKPAP